MQIEFELERVHAKIDPGGFSIPSLAKGYMSGVKLDQQYEFFFNYQD